jgi:RND family efflux transporter MFP subunit
MLNVSIALPGGYHAPEGATILDGSDDLVALTECRMRYAAQGMLFVLACFLLVWPFGCRQSESEEGSEPERQSSVEAGLRLTEEAKMSIGIVTARVQSQFVPSRISTTGWLAIKPGHEVTVKAVASGFVVPEEGGKLAALGDSLSAGQSLGTLRVFVSPQEEAQLVALKEDADILIRQSLASLEAAQARLERVAGLSESGTVSGKERQLAKEALEKARAAYEEAQQKLPFLPSEPYERPLQLSATAITSPRAGRLTKLHVQPRQFVMQGDPLWTISDWLSLWLRVPVFEDDLPRVAQTEPAQVSKPGMESPLPATPTGIPQPTEDGRRTVDFFYEVANIDGALRPGEAVSVELPTGKKSQQVVVPKSAILWDGMANAWVYLEEEKNLFRRQRIQIGPAVDEVVVVEQGLSEGQAVVTAGAEALYGEEFKGQIQALEDDD